VLATGSPVSRFRVVTVETRSLTLQVLTSRLPFALLRFDFADEPNRKTINL
jgi:hypothetical protein